MNAQKGYVIPLVLFGALILLSGISLFFYFQFYRAKTDTKTVPSVEPTPISLATATPTPKPVITDFDSCVKAGNPVAESYPRTCRAEGKVFTEIILEDSTSAQASSSAEIVKEGMVLYEGFPFLTKDPQSKFTIQYPVNWEREDNVVYPFGKGEEKARIVLGAGGSGWVSSLPIVTKHYSSGNASYSWGKHPTLPYYIGFATIQADGHSYVFTADYIDTKDNEVIQNAFDKMMETFKLVN